MKALMIWVLLMGCSLLAACGGDIEPGTTAAQRPVVSGLQLAPVTRQPLASAEVFPGTVESRDRATLTARIDGRVAAIAVAEGAQVAAGQELLRLTDNSAAAGLQQAQRQRDAAAAQAELANKTLARYQKLAAAEAVTPQELDRVTAAADQARAALAAAQAAVAQARTAVGHNRMVAPFAGRVVRQLTRVGATVLPGTPLLLLDRADAWQVRAEVPDSAALALGQAVTVELADARLDGSVRELLPGADPRSRSQQALIDLPAAPAVRAGLYARVLPVQTGATQLLAPAAAIVTRGQLTGVYALDGDILRWRLVRLGRTVGARVEVLSGLNAGERVVVSGLERAVDGARLEGTK